jgi:hypothetical protein
VPSLHVVRSLSCQGHLATDAAARYLISRSPSTAAECKKWGPFANCAARARALGAKTAMTYFEPKNMGDVRLLLGGLDDDVAVTLTPGTAAARGAHGRRPATPHGTAHKAPARGRASAVR